MFREFMGLPVHPLLIHAVVVFVPLLALVSVAYVVLPRFRSRLDWAAVALAVGAPVSALFAKLSGEELKEVLVARNYPPEGIAKIEEHQGYGDLTLWWSLALGVATVLLVVLTSRRRSLPGWLKLVLSGVVVVLGAISVYYVYLTGDTGAKTVWEGIL
ncbi:hypothetical protein I0C86_01985 [Plantactinospora sp. S1510]|uniref:DUF2231 domain-containing protein n=1 Tax=Plantactinospora alkalitolerans TaxID=2789879 RepID=A0ABS0GNL3_9ACTN|nr:DUF2231 domain-containing protein [Plantactinospora alkalitolerans]MBF9127772.1 hypothetical protein [Plantactinospora alkalitolerans]